MAILFTHLHIWLCDLLRTRRCLLFILCGELCGVWTSSPSLPQVALSKPTVLQKQWQTILLLQDFFKARDYSQSDAWAINNRSVRQILELVPNAIIEDRGTHRYFHQPWVSKTCKVLDSLIRVPWAVGVVDHDRPLPLGDRSAISHLLGIV